MRYQSYLDWLDRGFAADMGYMASAGHVEARRDLRVLLEGALSVVAVALAHPGPTHDPAHSIARARTRGFVARYSRGRDYHRVLAGKLRELAAGVGDALGAPVPARVCVDSAPVLERDLAEHAGLGFVGKNTMLIIPGVGSYVLLGELLLAAEVEPTGGQRSRPRCGSCRACLDACPTGAFAGDYQLDSRACISYLTIEHRGVIPAHLRPAMGTRIFGCDDCQEVCPYNAAAPGRVTPDPDLAPLDPEHAAPGLLDLLERGANQRKRFVRGTALTRLNREQWTRNLCVALGNAGDPGSIPALAARLEDPSALVRGHAAWALGRLGAVAPCTRALASEKDPFVLTELRSAVKAPRGS